MLNIAICDDNADFLALFRDNITAEFKKSLSADRQTSEPVCFESGNALLEYLNTNAVDILFLDIDMPSPNGFETAKIICDRYKVPIIVFVSAYESLVYESFNYQPFAFVRKAWLNSDLEKTVSRINSMLNGAQSTVVLNSAGVEYTVNISEILYFESKRNYFVTYFSGGGQPYLQRHSRFFRKAA